MGLPAVRLLPGPLPRHRAGAGGRRARTRSHPRPRVPRRPDRRAGHKRARPAIPPPPRHGLVGRPSARTKGDKMKRYRIRILAAIVAVGALGTAALLTVPAVATPPS